MGKKDQRDLLPEDQKIGIVRDELMKLRELRPDERDFIDDACVLRYIRANKGHVEGVAAALAGTLDWRQDFGTASLSNDMDGLREQSKSGKMYLSPSRDKEGHPVINLHPAREKVFEHEKSLNHLVYTLERAIRNMEGLRVRDDDTVPKTVSDSKRLSKEHKNNPGKEKVPVHDDSEDEESRPCEKFVWLVDFKGYSFSQSPPLKTSKATLQILANHYPERLHKALVLNPPWAFTAFWKVISPFIDPVTRNKVFFIKGKPEKIREKVSQHIHPEHFITECHGDLDFDMLREDSFEEYWEDEEAYQRLQRKQNKDGDLEQRALDDEVVIPH